VPATGAVMIKDGSPESRPTLSRAPGGLVLAWMDVTAGLPSAFVTWLDASLTPVASSTQRLGQSTAGASFPALVGDDAGLGVLWSDDRDGKYDLRFAQVTATGMGADSAVRSAMSNAFLGRIIRTDLGYMAAWEDTRTGETQVFMGLLDAAGDKTFEGVVEAQEGDANWPSLAWNGAATAVVFYQFRDGGQPRIYLTLVDAAGQRVGGGADLQVSESPKGSKARFPSVQWTGSEFGVAWVEARDTGKQAFFARVSCP
jgi:hypothetical protein